MFGSCFTMGKAHPWVGDITKMQGETWLIALCIGALFWGMSLENFSNANQVATW
jgi:hypothetical protein